MFGWLFLGFAAGVLVAIIGMRVWRPGSIPGASSRK
jgi:hypothetical protein